MRVCDWIAHYLFENGVERVHGLMGGGASGLNDGFIKHGKIQYICYHHEQGAGHAAIGEAKFTRKFSVVNPTTGCGGTNCATSVLDAWQDSIPVVFISGNVKLNSCSQWINEKESISIRKYGTQEHNIVDTYKSITKYSKFITSAEEVPYELQKAIYLATTDRPGPVWLDIPGDVQTAKLPEQFKSFIPETKEKFIDPSLEPEAQKQKMFLANKIYGNMFESIKKLISQSERPVILAGYGIRQSNTVKQFIQFVEKYQIPYVSTYGARDYASDDYEFNIGAVGIKGSRAGNFAMQNADLLLILGCSLGGTIVGYDPKQFSPKSVKIMVDIDKDEMNKNIVNVDHKINIDLNFFFKGMEWV